MLCEAGHAGCRRLRSRADAGRDPRDQRAQGAGRQACLELDRRADRRTSSRPRLRRTPTRNSRRPTRSPRSRRATTRIGEIKAAAIAALAAGEPPKFDAAKIGDEIGRLEYNLVRRRILAGERRIDGRDMDTVRPIRVETGVLPRTHGSALFTRGETQALVTTTLGTGRDAQIIDALSGERKEPFMLHYNFPPFSVGETGMMGSPKRREIGHGNLARRGISAVMPDMTTFPYVMRVVSEILESNGSSSMATVCGTSLALMDAGVPIKAPVAGVAMGLVLEGRQFQVLTDILGDEDHLGDMDFKVAGTRDGVTALQMDIKIEGITQGDHAGRARAGSQGAACTSSARWPRCCPSRARRCPSGRRRSSRSRSTRRRSAKSSARAVRSSARSPKRPAPRSTSRTTAPSRSPRSTAPRAARRSVASSSSRRTSRSARLRGQGRPAHGLRRLRADPAGQGRSRAHLADLGRARRARQRQAQGGRRDPREGARGRSPGPRAPQHAQRRRADGTRRAGRRSVRRPLRRLSSRANGRVSRPNTSSCSARQRW